MRTILPISFILGCAFLVASAHGQTDASDDALNEVISLAKEKAINASSVDWPTVEREAKAIAQDTPGEKGRTAAIRRVLSALDDDHSFYLPPMRRKSADGTDEAPRPLPSKYAGMAQRPPIAHSAAGKPFGHLVINEWTGPAEAVPEATGVVRDELNKALAANRCGLIVDVSSNKGGNMWPMMGGIAPLYSEGTLLSFADRAGKRKVVSVDDGALYLDGEAYPSTDQLASLSGSAPSFIAVILGRRTTSSGELAALAFKGQENVRFFGEPTAGKTTANWSTRLSNGGMLALATSKVVDRSGKVSQGPVMPDADSDAPIEDAIIWLQRRCGTSK